MPHVHTRQAKHKHHPKQTAQSQQQHQTQAANQDHLSPGIAAIPSEQTQAIVSPSSASSQSSQDQQPPSTSDQQIKQSQSSQTSRLPSDSQQQLSNQSHTAENDRQNPSTDVVTARPTGQSGEGRKISCEDIQLVQNLIERCLQLYMNQAEVIETLLNQAKIETGFTTLVWQKLEEQNPDFFKAYYTRLKLKKHITLFNHLLEQHVQQMQKMRMLPTKTAFPPPVGNGLHHLSFQAVPMGFPMPQQLPGGVHGHPHIIPSSSMAPLSPLLVHGGLQIQDSFQSSHGSPGQSVVTDMIEMPTSLHSSSSDMQFESINPTIPNSSAFPFNGNPSSPDMSIGIGLSATMPLETSFCTSDPHAQNGMSLPLGNADGAGNNTGELLGSLGHIPRNFSLSDLTAELSSHSDFGALGSYSSPFATSEMENFLRDPEKENYDSTKILEGCEVPGEKEFDELR